MKILANAFVLLLVALFGFGFLLDRNINLTRELIETKNKLAQVQADIQALEAQYQAALERQNQLEQKVSALTSENAALQARIQSLDAERRLLTEQVGTLQRQLNLIKTTDPVLAWLNANPNGRVAATLLVLPIVPLSLGAVYVITHAGAARLPAVPTSGQGSVPGTLRATLTREEFHFIARRRRSQAGSKKVTVTSRSG